MTDAEAQEFYCAISNAQRGGPKPQPSAGLYAHFGHDCGARQRAESLWPHGRTFRLPRNQIDRIFAEIAAVHASDQAVPAPVGKVES